MWTLLALSVLSFLGMVAVFLWRDILRKEETTPDDIVVRSVPPAQLNGVEKAPLWWLHESPRE